MLFTLLFGSNRLTLEKNPCFRSKSGDFLHFNGRKESIHDPCMIKKNIQFNLFVNDLNSGPLVQIDALREDAQTAALAESQTEALVGERTVALTESQTAALAESQTAALAES